jgi:hypothetical protein
MSTPLPHGNSDRGGQRPRAHPPARAARSIGGLRARTLALAPRRSAKYRRDRAGFRSRSRRLPIKAPTSRRAVEVDIGVQKHESPAIAGPSTVARVGFESSQVVEITTNNGDSSIADPSRVDVSTRTLAASGPTPERTYRTVEEALADALGKAAAAGEWDVVARLARELEARRLEGERR